MGRGHALYVASNRARGNLHGSLAHNIGPVACGATAATSSVAFINLYELHVDIVKVD